MSESLLSRNSLNAKRFTKRSASGESSYARRVADSIALGEMESACGAVGRRRVPGGGSPVLFQGVPDRPPVLSGRLNDDFLDRVLDQPVGQATQISRRST